MPKLSTHDAQQVDMGPGREVSEELGGYEVSYVTVDQVESNMMQRAQALSPSPR